MQAPVAEVDVADDGVAEVTVDALDALADDGRAEVADVQRLCDVRPAVVEHDGARRVRSGDAGTVGQAHILQMGGEGGVRDAQVDEAGRDGLRRGEEFAAAELRDDVVGDQDGCLVGGFGGGHGAVALEFAQVGTVGDGDLAAGGVIAGGGEGRGHRGG